MSNPVCAVIGVGPGNGTAIARKFSSEGYKIALLSRNEDYLNELAHECGDARAYPLDTTAPEKVFDKIKQELGSVDVLVYNAGSGMFGSVDTINLSDFEGAWRINALGLLAAVKAVLPDMLAAGKGNIVVIGATASVKHGGKLYRLYLGQGRATCPCPVDCEACGAGGPARLSGDHRWCDRYSAHARDDAG